MTTNDSQVPPDTLAAKRLAVRQQLQQQRNQIAKQTSVVRESDPAFPRSITMRLLMRRPAWVLGLLTQLAALVLGARLLKVVTATLLLTRLLLAARGTASVTALPAPLLPTQSPDQR